MDTWGIFLSRPQRRVSLEFHFTEEQEQFREFVRRFLNDTSPTTEVRRVMETEQGFDPGTWQRLSQELSLTGLIIPEAYGGAGFGNVELGIAMEEMGRALYPSPFFGSSVLAAKAIEYVASESEKSELLPSIAAGDKIAALAFFKTADRQTFPVCRCQPPTRVVVTSCRVRKSL